MFYVETKNEQGQLNNILIEVNKLHYCYYEFIVTIATEKQVRYKTVTHGRVITKWYIGTIGMY